MWTSIISFERDLLNMSNENEGSPIPVKPLVQTVGIFALVGAGLGLSGGFAITQLGGGGGISGGILSGVLVLVTLMTAFLIAPLVGVITGLRTGDQRGQTRESYLLGLLGSFAGYYVMIAIVILALILATVTILGGGDGGSTAAQSGASATSSSGGGFSVGEYLFPIIGISIPTALSGIGGVYFGTTGQSNSAKTKHPNESKGANNVLSDNSTLIELSPSDLPTRKIGIGVVLLIVIVAGVAAVPSLLFQFSQASELEVTGDSTISGDTVYATGEINNPTESEVDITLTVQTVIDGNVVGTGEKQITIPAGRTFTVKMEAAQGSELSDPQISAINSGQYKIDYIVDSQTVETYRS